MSPTPTSHVVESGDHSFKIPGRDAHEQAAVYANLQQTIVAWMRAIIGEKAPPRT